MNVAVCGLPSLALKVQDLLKTDEVEIKFFIRDFAINHGGEE